MNIDAITTQELSLPVFSASGVTVNVLRLDFIHPVVSGNKWFKLKYYLNEARALGKKCILTYGGAYSNHLVATAAAAQEYGLFPVGIVRGEKPARLSHTLEEAIGYGMKCIFISRDAYKEKRIPDQVYSFVPAEDIYVINEGGYGLKGALGCSEILCFCDPNDYTHLCCAVGTGTMLAGLVSASQHEKVIGISVMKNNPGLSISINALLPVELHNRYTLFHDYHFGGYAKSNKYLLGFMNRIYEDCHLPTDFVYTGKLLYGVTDLVQKNYFPVASKILLIHSGGLQGNNSLASGTLIF